MKLTGKEEILYLTIMKVLNIYKVLDSKPRDYGTGHLMYSSEIHTIDIIARCPDSNITGLSEEMGVTKGAVSQTVNRLEKKGMVEKHHDQGNDKEIHVRLTKKGYKAHQGHEEFHNLRDSKTHDYVRNLNDEQIDLLITFFQLFYEEISAMGK